MTTAPGVARPGDLGAIFLWPKRVRGKKIWGETT